MTSVARNKHTITGKNNWGILVEFAKAPAGSQFHAKHLAEALAALLAEVTPCHREVIASNFTTTGARGRIQNWPLPPGITEGHQAQERWAALVFLDCVDYVSDTLANHHSLEERTAWRAHAESYTKGAENKPTTGSALPTSAPLTPPVPAASSESFPEAVPPTQPKARKLPFRRGA